MEETTDLVSKVNVCSGDERTLSDQSVQVLKVGALETKVSSANVVDSLVVDHEGTIGMLKGGVGGEDRIVGLNNGSSCLGSGVDTELKLDLLSKIDRQTLHKEGSETRTSSASEGMEDQETLETRAVVGNAADLVHDLINQLLANSVVTTSVVVRGILLSSNHQLGVEQAAVGAGADLIDDVGLEIAVDGTGNIFSLA